MITGIGESGTTLVANAHPVIAQAAYSKCANPNCGSRFNFRQGQIRRIMRDENGLVAVKHFWLCRDCSKLFSLDCSGNRLRLVPRQPGFTGNVLLSN